MSTFNFNIGLLGHVDSGKTSLAKALSSVASTACFDKNPQSKERGITLDLGFSSFTVDASVNLKEKGFDFVQYTLVDCPGHASLIKTIIGGAQIIDLMILVIDIEKGMQTQTSECLIIGEICCNKIIVVLNKFDLIEESKREKEISKMKSRLVKTFEKTKFANCSIVAVSANLELNKNENSDPKVSSNIPELIETIKQHTIIPDRKKVNENFLFAIDHCFTIRGQGTVLTGTILSGNVKTNDVWFK